MIRRFRATGRVQGVNYRAFVQRHALRLGIAGWVRNEPDGSVSGIVSGPDDVVAALVDALQRGPPNAIVRSVDLDDAPDDDAPTPFQIRG